MKSPSLAPLVVAPPTLEFVVILVLGGLASLVFASALLTAPARSRHGVKRAQQSVGDAKNKASILATNTSSDARSCLTELQIEIVSYLLQGRNVPYIGSMLLMSESSVRNQIRVIYRVFNVHSKQELIDCLEPRIRTVREM